MHHRNLVGSTRARSTVRTLSRHEELPLLRDHLLRLDRAGRHDRFHGFIDDSFIEGYAEKCANDGTIVIAYFEDGVVRGAAELHPPEQSPNSLPEIAFSVEAPARRRGVGSFLFRQLIAEARAKGYRKLRITTGAQNVARQQVRRASDVQSGRNLPARSMLSSTVSRNRRPSRSDSRARSRLHARLRLPIAHTGGCCSKCMAGAGRPNQRRLSEPLDRSVEWLGESIGLLLFHLASPTLRA